MRKRLFMVTVFVLCFIGFVFESPAQEPLSVKALVEKNVQAAGGTDKIASIKNCTFTLGPETVYVTADGQMKITTGKAPVISEITLVNKDKVIKNCFNEVTELTGSDKSITRVLAMLRSGLYTMSKLESLLKSEGIKRFGPVIYYAVSAQAEGLKVYFYLDSTEFTIKRIVFQGQDKKGESYEMSQDFGPYQTMDGITLPTSWYSAKVGARGETYTMENVKWNQPLEGAFFTDYAVNVGTVKIAKGELSGQIVDVGRMGNYVVIYTNWTPKCIQQAGFAPKDKLMLQISNKALEVVLEESQPSRTAMSTGGMTMFPSASGVNYVILLSQSAGNDISESLAPMQTINIKSKV